MMSSSMKYLQNKRRTTMAKRLGRTATDPRAEGMADGKGDGDGVGDSDLCFVVAARGV